MDQNVDQLNQNRKNIGYGDINQVGGTTGDYLKQEAFPMEDKAYQDYAMFQRSQQKPIDLYNQEETAAGLPQMRKTASTLRGAIGDVEDALKRVEPDVSLRSRNSIVTEAQRRAMVNSEQAPLLSRLGELTTGLGRVGEDIRAGSENIAQKIGLVMQGQEIDRDTYKMNLDLMSRRAAQLASGFSDDREMRYNFLMDKLNRQRTLADSEWAEANELNRLKMSYDREDARLKQEAEAALKQSQSPQVVSLSKNESAYLIDPQTGRVIQKYGSSGGGGGTTSGGISSYYGMSNKSGGVTYRLK